MRERGSDGDLLERLALEIRLNDPRAISFCFESIKAQTREDGSVSLAFTWMPVHKVQS